MAQELLLPAMVFKPKAGLGAEETTSLPRREDALASSPLIDCEETPEGESDPSDEHILTHWRNHMKRLLDTAVNIAIVLASISIMFMAYMTYTRAPKLSEGMKVGTILPVPGVPLATKTLIAAIQPGCRFCEESLPFYQLLQHRDDFQILVPRDPGDYYEKRGFGKNKVHTADFKALRVIGTPTLVYVDQHGKVLRLWQGKLGPAGEQDVFAMLK